MWCRCIREQTIAVKDKDLVHAIGEYLALNLVLDACSAYYRMQFHAQFVGQFAALGEQFLRNLLHLGAFYLYIYEYVVHKFGVKY